MCPLLSLSPSVIPNRCLRSLLVCAVRWLLEWRRQCKLHFHVEWGGGYVHMVLMQNMGISGYLGMKSSEHSRGHRGPV